MALKRLVIAIMLAASVATAQDWNSLGMAWTVPSGASVLGGAVDLEGSTAEYFIDASTNVLAEATSFSLSTWVRVHSVGLSRGIILARSGTSTKLVGLVVSTSTNIVSYSSSTTAGNFYDLGNNSITLDVWTHIVSTWENGTNIVYVNGVANVYTTALTTPIEQNTEFRIGRDTSGTARYLDGLIDDTGVYANRVLSATEVSEAYNSGAGKSLLALSTGTNGLVRYWTMDDGLSNPSATNAYDSAGGTYATGTGIGSGDWTNGIVPIN